MLDGRASWTRLGVLLLISSIGGVGMWSVVVTLPAVQAEFGAARAGAASVEAAEIDPLAVAAIRLNAALNGVEVSALAEDVVGQPCRWDRVVAGDVCYEAPMARRVLPWLRSLAAAGAEVWLADPGRAYAPSGGFEPVARVSVPVTRELEDRDVREVTVSRLLPP